MELRQLLYFTAIAQAGTITAAAQKLHMSQPPLSLQLQKLEEELGCPLFERDTRHLRLTQAGELFYERAQGILQQCADLKREMADLQAGGRGLLRIGVVSSLSTSLLPRWVARFHSSYPMVRLELTERDSYRLLELVRGQRIDLALVRRPFSSQGLEIHPICSEPMCAVGQKHFFGECDGPIAPQALSQLPLLLYRRWESVLMRFLPKPDLNHRCFAAVKTLAQHFVWLRKDLAWPALLFPPRKIFGRALQCILCRPKSCTVRSVRLRCVVIILEPPPETLSPSRSKTDKEKTFTNLKLSLKAN